MKKKYKNVSIFYGCIVMVYTLAEGLFGYGFTAFMYNRGISLAYIGVLLGMTDFFLTIFDYPSGNFADKFGRKKICGIGFLIYGIGFCFFASAQSVGMFFVSCVIRALGTALISGAPVTWYLGELSKMDAVSYKDKVLPVVRGLSLLFGSVSGILAAKMASYHMAFPIYLGGILLMISGVFILLCFQDNKAESVQQTHIVALTIANTRKFAKDKAMIVLVLFTIAKAVPFSIFIVSWQVFATEKIGIETGYLGILYTIMLLLMSFTSFIVKHLLMKMKGPLISAIGGGISCLGIMIFICCNSSYVFLTGFIAYEAGLGILNSSYYTWLYDYIPEDVLSSYSSALSSIESFVSFLMSLCIGGLIEVTGYRFGWIIAMFFEVASVTFLALINSKRKK